VGKHGIGNLDETSDVGADDIVAGLSVLLGGGGGVLVDVDHDGIKLGVNLLTGPGQPQAVLGHLKSGSGDTTSVGGLSGGEKDALGVEDFDGLRSARHVGTLTDGNAAGSGKSLSVNLVELVLGGARKSDVNLGGPDAVALGVSGGDSVGGSRVLSGVLADSATLVVLQIHDEGQLLTVNTLGVVDPTTGVGHGDRNTAQVQDLLASVLGHVSGSGKRDGGTLEGLALGGKHLTGEVDQTVTGGLRTDEGSSVLKALSGQDTSLVVVLQLLVHAEQVADLTATDTDITSRDIKVVSDVTPQSHHEGLAESHDLGISLSLGVEVTSSLSSSHWQTGQRVLKDLLEGRQET